MAQGIDRFNRLSSADARALLLDAFASAPWAERVSAGRPYANFEQLMERAEAEWSDLSPKDWREAFAAHPRIGESGGHSPRTSAREQSRVLEADHEILAQLASENRRYEARFGHVFLIAAQGRGAAEILAALRERIDNDEDTELRIAAAEQRQITRLRLERVLNQ